MLHKVYEYAYRAIEWIGAGISYLIYQIGISFEIQPILMNAFFSSAIHGIMSMLVPVCSFWIIHIAKRMLEDKDSWMSRYSEGIVKFLKFKK